MASMIDALLKKPLSSMSVNPENIFLESRLSDRMCQSLQLKTFLPLESMTLHSPGLPSMSLISLPPLLSLSFKRPHGRAPRDCALYHLLFYSLFCSQAISSIPMPLTSISSTLDSQDQTSSLSFQLICLIPTMKSPTE